MAQPSHSLSAKGLNFPVSVKFTPNYFYSLKYSLIILLFCLSLRLKIFTEKEYFWGRILCSETPTRTDGIVDKVALIMVVSSNAYYMSKRACGVRVQNHGVMLQQLWGRQLNVLISKCPIGVTYEPTAGVVVPHSSSTRDGTSNKEPTPYQYNITCMSYLLHNYHILLWPMYLEIRLILHNHSHIQASRERTQLFMV
jgi:hypothetical protein